MNTEQEPIPEIVSDIAVCRSSKHKLDLNEAQSANPSDCEVDELVNSHMELTEIKPEKRPQPGKLTIIYGHGSTIVNEYFVVPKGYYFYFDTVKSESTYNFRSGKTIYTNPETGKQYILDPFNIKAMDPETRHLAIDESVFMHQYAPGDVMTNHNITFYPGLGDTNLSESELKTSEHEKLITGIVQPNVAIRPGDFIYFDNDIRTKFMQIPGFGEIPFNYPISLFDLIKTGILMTNNELYTLPPGHFVLKNCRNLIYSGPTEQDAFTQYNITEAKFNNMPMPHQTLIRQASTGQTNTYNNARSPSNEPNPDTIWKMYSKSQIFRPEIKSNKASMKNLTPLSSALGNKAANAANPDKRHNKKSKKQYPQAAQQQVSRVYVTTPVRQEFDSKIRYYNKVILPQYESMGLVPREMFQDMYPYNAKTNKYKQIVSTKLLTPYQVYNVMMAANCFVCGRNLAKLPESKLCSKCHLIGFCATHFTAKSRVTQHKCYSNTFTKGKAGGNENKN
jgi:hypothetical protein